MERVYAGWRDLKRIMACGGLKPFGFGWLFAARLKPCPVAKLEEGERLLQWEQQIPCGE